MSAPRIDYETHEDGRTRAEVYGGNGELVYKTEVYETKSNADRGLADIARIVLQLVADGKINMNRVS